MDTHCDIMVAIQSLCLQPHLLINLILHFKVDIESLPE